MRSKVIILLSAAVLAAVCLGVVRMAKYMKNVRGLTIGRIDLSTLHDGTYRGTFDLELVKTEVDVVVQNHRIQKIDIIQHENGRGNKAEAIADRVLARQQLDVDVVSGATASSKALLKAIENALTVKNETH